MPENTSLLRGTRKNSRHRQLQMRRRQFIPRLPENPRRMQCTRKNPRHRQLQMRRRQFIPRLPKNSRRMQRTRKNSRHRQLQMRRRQFIPRLPENPRRMQCTRKNPRHRQLQMRRYAESQSTILPNWQYIALKRSKAMWPKQRRLDMSLRWKNSKGIVQTRKVHKWRMRRKGMQRHAKRPAYL